MTAYSLSLMAAPDELLSAANAITYRHATRWRSLVAIGVMIGTGTVAGLGVGHFSGVPISDAMMISVYAVIGNTFAFLVLQRFASRRHRAAFATSALYRSVMPVTFAPGGLTVEARPFDWSKITTLGRHNDATLMYFSSVDALVVPDRDLPASLTPDGLAAQIAAWRAA